ncbi:hypothetical protein [Streptomyces sp. NPDC093260]|uniref:hypothetical protein n=1 Tax=Streptomyces sp. NPDC093260 TaxID=3155073 RepID=UPI00341C1474
MTRLLRGDRAPEDAEGAPEGTGGADDALRSGPDDTPSGTAERAPGKAGPGSPREDPDAEETGPQADRDDPGTQAAVPRAGRDDSDAGRPRPEAGADEPAGDAVGEAAGRRPAPGRLRVITLAALTVVLVLAGCGFLHRAHGLRSAPAAENRALTDAQGTTRVADDIAEDLARVFSYTPDGLDATERSARTVLTGRAARQYTHLLARIRADVTQQRVTLSTQAVRTGVIRLDGDDARLLVFLDQFSRRGKAAGTSAAAQLTVAAHRENGQWRIVDIITR